MPAVQVPCPQCNSYRTYVIATNSTDKGIIRRRKCTACDHRWYTRQSHEQLISRYDIIHIKKKPHMNPDCNPSEQQQRQVLLDEMYAADGRHDKNHPMHALYTNLAAAKESSK
jgi:transcriptional regulator NrdR family protein